MFGLVSECECVCLCLYLLQICARGLGVCFMGFCAAFVCVLGVVGLRDYFAFGVGVAKLLNFL